MKTTIIKLAILAVLLSKAGTAIAAEESLPNLSGGQRFYSNDVSDEFAQRLQTMPNTACHYILRYDPEVSQAECEKEFAKIAGDYFITPENAKECVKALYANKMLQLLRNPECECFPTVVSPFMPKLRLSLASFWLGTLSFGRRDFQHYVYTKAKERLGITSKTVNSEFGAKCALMGAEYEKLKKSEPDRTAYFRQHFAQMAALGYEDLVITGLKQKQDAETIYNGLSGAAENGHLAIVKHIIKTADIPREVMQEALSHAKKGKQVAICNFLLGQLEEKSKSDKVLEALLQDEDGKSDAQKASAATKSKKQKKNMRQQLANKQAAEKEAKKKQAELGRAATAVRPLSILSKVSVTIAEPSTAMLAEIQEQEERMLKETLALSALEAQAKKEAQAQKAVSPLSVERQEVKKPAEKQLSTLAALVSAGAQGVVAQAASAVKQSRAKEKRAQCKARLAGSNVKQKAAGSSTALVAAAPVTLQALAAQAEQPALYPQDIAEMQREFDAAQAAHSAMLEKQKQEREAKLKAEKHALEIAETLAEFEREKVRHEQEITRQRQHAAKLKADRHAREVAAMEAEFAREQLRHQLTSAGAGEGTVSVIASVLDE